MIAVLAMAMLRRQQTCHMFEEAGDLFCYKLKLNELFIYDSKKAGKGIIMDWWYVVFCKMFFFRLFGSSNIMSVRYCENELF